MTTQDPPSHEPSASRPPAAVHLYRMIVWLAVAAATLVVITRPFAPFPDAPHAGALGAMPNFQSSITSAGTRNALNEARADSAPQQQVTNGWYANDLLEVVAEENISVVEALRELEVTQREATQSAWEMDAWRAEDRRIESLLVIFGLGAAAHLAGSSLIVLLARRQSKGAAHGPEPEAANTNDHLDLEPGTESFDPRPQ